jgi:hypothetical protein
MIIKKSACPQIDDQEIYRDFLRKLYNSLSKSQIKNIINEIICQQWEYDLSHANCLINH